MSLELEVSDLFTNIHRTLVTWVTWWFDPAVAEELVGLALNVLLSEARLSYRTPHGPWARLFHHLEYAMRIRSYSTGNVVPLGLNRMYPCPDKETLTRFTGLYCSVKHFTEMAGTTWDEMGDIAAYIEAYRSTVERYMPDPDEERSIANGAHMLIYIGSIVEAHTHGGTECDEAFAFKRQQWAKTEQWRIRHGQAIGSEVSYGKATQDNDPGISGSFLSAD